MKMLFILATIWILWKGIYTTHWEWVIEGSFIEKMNCQEKAQELIDQNKESYKNNTALFMCFPEGIKPL